MGSDGSSEPRPGGASYLHVSSPPSEAQQLLVLAGDEVHGGVLQQGREDEEQTHGHPDVDGFYVGHLQTAETRQSHTWTDVKLLVASLMPDHHQEHLEQPFLGVGSRFWLCAEHLSLSWVSVAPKAQS